MVFEVGKYYKHTTGHMLHVINEIETELYGKTLLAENAETYEYFTAVGRTEDNAVNYKEITKDEWNKAWEQVK